MMLGPLVAPKVAVPVKVMLPGAVAGVQFALALKSKTPGLTVTVGLASHVALWAEA